MERNLQRDEFTARIMADLAERQVIEAEREQHKEDEYWAYRRRLYTAHLRYRRTHRR